MQISQPPVLCMLMGCSQWWVLSPRGAIHTVCEHYHPCIVRVHHLAEALGLILTDGPIKYQLGPEAHLKFK